MGADMISGSQLQSNLSLPFGKVRMGYPLGKLGWVIIRGGTDSLGSSYQTSGQAGFCLSPNGVCHIGDKWATSVQQTCPSGATCLPMLGNVLAPSGHAACPKLHKNPNEMKRLTHQQE